MHMFIINTVCFHPDHSKAVENTFPVPPLPPNLALIPKKRLVLFKPQEDPAGLL